MSQFQQRQNVKFYQNLDKPASETFQTINQAYGEEALGRSGTNVLYKGETVWKVMSIPVGQELDLNSGSKKLQRWCVPAAPKR
jgi:hypothetical protein